MRMKMVCDDRALREVANAFLVLKKAQKVRERTLNDYKKYIDKFLEQSENSLDVDVLKMEILEYFADIPKTSPARFVPASGYISGVSVNLLRVRIIKRQFTFKGRYRPLSAYKLCNLRDHLYFKAYKGKTH